MIMSTYILSKVHSIVLLLFTFFAAFSLMLLTSFNAEANAVTITDQAGVLNVGKVRTEAATLANPIVIFTTKTFGGDQAALNQATREQLPTQDAIAIEIDTVHRHMSVESGKQVKLSNDQASSAVSAFKDGFHGGDYTGATIAAIDSVRDELNGGESSLTPLGAFIGLVLAGGAVALVLFIAFRWKRPPSDRGRGMESHIYNHAYNHTYYGGANFTAGSTGGGYGGGAGGSF